MLKTFAATRRLALGLAAGALALGALAAQPSHAEWRGWNIHVPDYPVSAAMDWFAAELAARSGGRLTAQTYHGGVLGDQPDAIEQVRLGGIEFAVFNLGPMGPTVPATNVVNLPFIFKSVDHMHRVMDGEVGDLIAAAMAEKGLVALAWYDSGARSFYTVGRPIAAPADMAGMKIRVMNNELFVGMVEALGGNATPMAFAEVYQSLKTGVVDGAENNWPSYESTNHFEVARFYSGTEHLIIPECFCVNKGIWDALSPEDQTLVRTIARESAAMQRELWAARSDASRAAVEAAGITFVEIADKSPFQAAMAPVYAKAVEATPELAPLIEAIRAVE